MAAVNVLIVLNTGSLNSDNGNFLISDLHVKIYVSKESFIFLFFEKNV